MWYTIFYTVQVGYVGTIGCVGHVKTSASKTFEQALALKGIDLTQVSGVFEGKHAPITSDWSKL